MSWDFWCDTFLEATQLSPCFRKRILRVIVPNTPLALSIALSAISTLCNTHLAAGIRTLLRPLRFPLGAPFSQFLEFRDLSEYDASAKFFPPPWKRRALQYLSAAQALIWIAHLAHQIEIQAKSVEVYLTSLNVATWLCACLIALRVRIETPPYLMLLFYIFHSLSAAIDLLSELAGQPSTAVAAIISSGIRLLLGSCLVWIAGSLPLRNDLPGPRVASARDTPSSELSSPEDRVTLWTWLSFSFVEPIMDLAVLRSKTPTVVMLSKDKYKVTSEPAPGSASELDGGGGTSTSTLDPVSVGSSQMPSPSTLNGGTPPETSDAIPARPTPSAPRTLNEEDIWSLPPTFKHQNLFEKFLATWRPGESLTWYLLRSNSLDLIIALTVEFWCAIVGFVPPYALKQILALLSSNAPDAKTQAYLYGLLTFVAHLTFAQEDLFKGWHSRRCYERTRGQLFCILHWKALKLREFGGRPASGDEKDTAADLGKIVNLMQGDTYAVAQRFWDFSPVFSAPVRLVIALVFLYNVLGWSSLAGVLVVVIAWIMNYPLAKWNISITRSSWRAKDKRMSGVNELFQNIRFLKIYGWDNLWASKVNELRERELNWRVKEAIVDTIISFIWTWIPSATALLSFMSYTLIAQEELTVSKAFVSVALFEQLQAPMTALPGQVFALLHAYVSMQRIESFLAEEEVPAWASTLKAGSSLQPDGAGETRRLGFEHATFEWHTPFLQSGANLGPENNSERPLTFRLSDLDICFPIGKLTLVIGRTGSGKSALLSALLGEMCCISGKVHMDKRNHKFAFCGQNPWLEHATIRDNILYGCEYDEDKYLSVVSACALEPDLAMLPGGDATEIGEKGVTLSGGQRSRIALARAVYSRAEFLLLDDPLAAVDMHTANHLYEQCFSGELLRGRTVVLVTHHVALCLPSAEYIVEMSGGRVSHQGTIEELQHVERLRHVVEADTPAVLESADDGPGHNEADVSVESEEKEPLGASLRVDKGKLVEAEARAEGRVKFSTYLTYIRACGWPAWTFTILFMVAIRGITILNQMFLAQWGQAYGPSSSRPPILEHLPPPYLNVKPWLMIFLVISLAGAFSTLLYIAIGYYSSLQASRRLFIAMLFRLTRAPSRFFDVTPLGRVLNRFVTDFGTVDGALNNSARAALSGALTFVSSFGVIVVLVPSFLPAAAFIAYLYVRLAPAYILASRDLRRLELTSLSFTFAGFDELLQGLAHVRAFGMESRYQERFYKKVDKFQSFDHVYWLLSIWMRWRYDCLGSVVVFFATVFSLWSGINSGLAAVVIVQAGVFAEASRQLIKVSAQLELDFNSVERIAEYLEVPSEAPAVIQDRRPPAYWPSSSGSLVVEDLTVTYDRHLPAVLRELSFSVNPGEKIGVVGRTGAGKSTLILSLLRMVEPVSGRIIVDGIDISTIGLEDLRTRITIISQNVSLFEGTIRSNIDPFEEHSDQECWEILKRCHLTSGSEGGGPIQTLDTPIQQSGSLSAGEKQLVALARALLRRSQIVLMDEATSQVDTHLDDTIQRTIREELEFSTVITIAHRLKTIIDYDKILVLGSEGRVIEFDTPYNLLKMPTGVFAEMCRCSPNRLELISAISRRYSGI